MEVPEQRATRFSLSSPKADPLPTPTEPRMYTLVVGGARGRTDWGDVCTQQGAVWAGNSRVLGSHSVV